MCHLLQEALSGSFGASSACPSSIPGKPSFCPLTELVSVSPLEPEPLGVTGGFLPLSLTPGTGPGTQQLAKRDGWMRQGRRAGGRKSMGHDQYWPPFIWDLLRTRHRADGLQCHVISPPPHTGRGRVPIFQMGTRGSGGRDAHPRPCGEKTEAGEPFPPPPFHASRSAPGLSPRFTATSVSLPIPPLTGDPRRLLWWKVRITNIQAQC